MHAFESVLDVLMEMLNLVAAGFDGFGLFSIFSFQEFDVVLQSFELAVEVLDERG